MNKDLAEILLDNHSIEEEFYKTVTGKNKTVNKNICTFVERLEINKELLKTSDELVSYFHGVMNNLEENSDIKGVKTLEAYKASLTKDEAAEAIQKQKNIEQVKNSRVPKKKITRLSEQGLSIGEIIQETGADGKRVSELL